jgi:hypothetical protein
LPKAEFGKEFGNEFGTKTYRLDGMLVTPSVGYEWASAVCVVAIR